MKKMTKNLVLALLGVNLLVISMSAQAVKVESTTGVHLTFRKCVSGETACDSVSATLGGKKAGLPGDTETNDSAEDSDSGSVKAGVQFTCTPGGSKHHGHSMSLAGTRNGANTMMLKKYTNTSTSEEIVSFKGVLSFEQSIPDENAGFPTDSPGRSGAVAEMGIVEINVDTVEAGTTVEENIRLLYEGPEGDVGLTEKGSDSVGGTTNISETGTRTISVTTQVKPGGDIWLWAITQSLAANGAEVTLNFTTQLIGTPVDHQ